MKHSHKVGLCFGLTSGVITTLGLMIGLYSSTHSKLVVVGGILTIAFVDSLSDAFGIHISEESENKHSKKEIWESTFSTFFSKLIVALSFIIPVLIFDLKYAIYVSVIWGFSLLCLLSYNIGKNEKEKTWFVILEHLLIAIIVVIVAYYIGQIISFIFG